MQRFMIVIPRDAVGEVTFGFLYVEYNNDATARQYSSVQQVKVKVIDIVTRWVKQTDEGRQAWEDSDKDLNFGDLCNSAPDQEHSWLHTELFNAGLNIIDCEVASMDDTADAWKYDDVLVNTKELEMPDAG